MNIEDVINEVCDKEILNKCYDYLIDDIPIYTFIRRDVRTEYLNKHGVNFNESQSVGDFGARIKSVFLSLLHIIRFKQKRKYLFHTFRLENINGVWTDRFMDPFILYSGISEDSFVICETNKGRAYEKRLNRKNICYDDMLAVLAVVCTRLTSYYLYKFKYKKVFDELFVTIRKFNCITETKRKKYICDVINNIYRIKFYKWIFRRFDVKFVIAASRSSFLPLMCAAHKNGIKVYELQHGISFEPSVTYGGYNHNLFKPDKFLAFGNIKDLKYYGIEEKDCIDIGFALLNYIKDGVPVNIDSNENVLVMSQPDVTEFVIEKTIHFAEINKERNFVFRCHPLEVLTKDQEEKLKRLRNISIHDNRISSIVAINSFKYIICVKSSVIYEALSFGKKVGVLSQNEVSMSDLGNEGVTQIDSDEAFKKFLNGKDKTEVKSIYSRFNKEIVDNLLK